MGGDEIGKTDWKIQGQKGKDWEIGRYRVAGKRRRRKGWARERGPYF